MTNKAIRRAMVGWEDPSSILIGRGPSPTTQMQPNACFASKLILSSRTPPSEAERCHDDKKHWVTKDNVGTLEWDTSGWQQSSSVMMRSAEQSWWPNLVPRFPHPSSPHHHSHHTSPSNSDLRTDNRSLSTHQSWQERIQRSIDLLKPFSLVRAVKRDLSVSQCCIDLLKHLAW